jgi:GNAT superfamily N-acetyltransferase
LEKELEALVHAHREKPLNLDALLRRMTILHRSTELTEEELYFLARMTYSHLQPMQRAHLEMLEEGGETTAELVEESQDDEGGPLFLRAALNPKEIMRLHHLFDQSGLSVVFRPEHRFMVGIDQHGIVCGGLFYRSEDRVTTHMEKIVVGPRYRRKGVGDRIMETFLQRMRDQQQKRVTTGFFRPHYFYRFGFRLERGFGGLVKDLEGEDSPSGQPSPA